MFKHGLFLFMNNIFLFSFISLFILLIFLFFILFSLDNDDMESSKRCVNFFRSFLSLDV